jgi:hypothetical protein
VECIGLGSQHYTEGMIARYQKLLRVGCVGSEHSVSSKNARTLWRGGSGNAGYFCVI